MYATTRQFLDYFNLKSLDQLPALAEIRDLETLNAELGFTEPLPQSVAEGEAGAPELTVVGGTEHTPEEADGEMESGEPVAQAFPEDDDAAQPEAHLDDVDSDDPDAEVEPEARA